MKCYFCTQKIENGIKLSPRWHSPLLICRQCFTYEEINTVTVDIGRPEDIMRVHAKAIDKLSARISKLYDLMGFSE